MEEMILKKVKPMFNGVITTMDTYREECKIPGSNLLDVSKTKGTVKEYQKVLAVGDMVHSVKVGDIIAINPIRYGRKKHQDGSLKDGIISDNPIIEYRFNTIVINDQECLYLQDNDISFIVEEFIDNKIKPSVKTNNSTSNETNKKTRV